MSDWEQVALEDICTFVNGGTPSRKNPDYFRGTIPWITGADVTDNVITNAREYITQQAIEESSTHIVPRGNLLLVTRTGVGKVAVAGVDICISQDFTGLIPDKNQVSEWYLLYFFKAKAEHLVSQQRGATIQGITRETVATLRVPLPSLPEQQRIAAILDRADRLRRTRRYAAQLSDTFLQAVCVRMFGDARTNPMGWETVKLENVCKEITVGYVGPMVKEYVESGIPFLRSQNVSSLGIDLTDVKYISTDFHTRLKKSALQPGNVVVVRTGNAGDACVVPQTLPVANCSDLVIIRLSETINAHYLMALFNSSWGQGKVASGSVGQIQRHFNIEMAREMLIHLPPLTLQEKFAHIVQQFERLRAQQREAERQAEHLFQTLLYRAFSEEG